MSSFSRGCCCCSAQRLSSSAFKNQRRVPSARRRSVSFSISSSASCDDDDAEGNDDGYAYRDVELNVHLLSPDRYRYDANYTMNRRVIIQEQEQTIVPVYAKPPLAFLLGVMCAMPIALWEAKRRVRLDARIYGGLDSSSSSSSLPPRGGSYGRESSSSSSSSSSSETSRGPQPPKATPSSSSSPSSGGPGKRALKASTMAALARVNPEMYLPTPKERSYGHQSSAMNGNSASGEGMSMERKGARESKVTFSRIVDGARSVIASAATSTMDAAVATMPTVVIEEDEIFGSGDEDLDIMRLRDTNDSNSISSSSSSTSRTLIAVRWSPPEHDPSATILVGGNVQQLGSWTPENCAPMKSIGGNKWIADIGHIAAATEIEFKFVIESENFGRRAETGEVRKFNVPVLRGGETRYTHVARQAPRWSP
jgi:hypothetical protein